GATPEHPGDYRLADAADAKGFLLAFPEGMNRGWNDGRVNPERNKYDDVPFLSAVIDDLVRTQNVDPKHVYSTGMSNGGVMSFRLACDLADKIAAIASVVGSMPENGEASCKPSHPVLVLMINGNADPLVRFQGGQAGMKNHGRSEPIFAVVNFWRRQICGG